jgi:phytoene/squalene synthetase
MSKAMTRARAAQISRAEQASAARAASTFEPGLRLLPRDLQVDARKLYGLLSTVDDLVDEHDPQAASRVDAIERWARGEDADTPETRTLSDLAQRYPLPPEAILEFCEGMRHDLTAGTLATEADLERYCQCVGGAIGVVLTRMFGSADPSCESRMAMLGRAFQRTNILRDIDEDHDHGRVYVARRTIERFGSPTPGAREALLRDQIARADQLYDEGRGAISLLSRGGRGMAVSVSLYREILRQIERAGYGRQRGRVTVPRWRVHLLVLKHRLKPTYT